MAKLTAKAKGSGKSSITKGKTHNKAGGAAYALNDKARLVTGVLTCFVNEPKFYGDTTDDIIKTARKVIKTDPDFVAKLACYTRNVFHMRTVSQVLAAEVAKYAKGSQIVRPMVRKVIERPDDITNILAYHFATWGKRQNGNPVPRSLRRGIADVFGKFDEYQLAKYKQTDREVKLRDVVKIARPKPVDDTQAALWNRLIENKLKTPETRETILSSKGQSRETWEEFIHSGKMGYMAMLRNLKNFLSYGVSSETLNVVAEKLRNPNAVRKSKQLPFRFYTAYKMLETAGNVDAPVLMDALEDALMVSFENLPQLKGTTAIICDESGSMTWSNTSERSVMRMIDIGNLLGSVAHKFCEKAYVIPFGASAKIVTPRKKSSVFDNMSKLEYSGVGHATYVDRAFQELDKCSAKLDRVILFSDMQCYGTGASPIGNYERKIRQANPDMWIHSIDLQGYGTTKVLGGNRVNLVAGWSDKVLDFIHRVENGGDDLIKEIEAYQI